MKPSSAFIRPATPADFDAILGLNGEWEHFTSPLDASRLARLHAQALYHRVCEQDAQVVAFLLAFGPGADYDSPNYRYFDDAGRDFIYIDRIVVGHAHQRSGLGDALYDDLLGFARNRGAAKLTCEVDFEPLNAVSDRFHTRRGFAEVGTQRVADGRKCVSLREHIVS
ncbi:MAG: GNAT family N-acetyltransferase [Coriobacteriia bacterium]